MAIGWSEDAEPWTGRAFGRTYGTGRRNDDGEADRKAPSDRIVFTIGADDSYVQSLREVLTPFYDGGNVNLIELGISEMPAIYVRRIKVNRRATVDAIVIVGVSMNAEELQAVMASLYHNLVKSERPFVVVDLTGCGSSSWLIDYAASYDFVAEFGRDEVERQLNERMHQLDAARTMTRNGTHGSHDRPTRPSWASTPAPRSVNPPTHPSAGLRYLRGQTYDSSSGDRHTMDIDVPAMRHDRLPKERPGQCAPPVVYTAEERAKGSCGSRYQPGSRNYLRQLLKHGDHDTVARFKNAMAWQPHWNRGLW